MFYLEECPHCKRASKMIEVLKEKNPQYVNVEIEKIEEEENVELANQFDYELVPTFYIEKEKLHEGVPSLEAIETVLKKAIEA